jgi:hypothetical protein
MHRILNSHTLGLILATLSWAVVAWIVYLLCQLTSNGPNWIYLDW